MPSPGLTYVLVTPARNEAAFIELTLQSVTSQSLLPLKWVVVSDGSTDATDDLVRQYAAKHPWIELIRAPARTERDFAGKVYAFNLGYARVAALNYDIIGSMDADISFDADYFAFLMSKFAADPQLGVAGTPFTEDGKTYDYRYASLEHVSGACQLFRRKCFDAIGGYVPLKEGGIDLVAVTTARMRGWTTRSFTEKTCAHHRKTQSGSHMSVARMFKSGYHDYLMGSAPLWQIVRCLRRLLETPLFVGGGALLAGFLWAWMTQVTRPVSSEFIAFRQREQRQRLARMFKAG